MVWLEEADVHAIQAMRWALEQAQTAIDLQRRALTELIQLVPADVASWNRITLSSGAIEHEAVPAEGEPRGAFQEVTPTAAVHPLLHPHAVRPRPAVRLSEAVDPRRLHRSEIYGELLHRSSAEWGISFAVRVRSREAVVFALGRHEREFSERDRDVLNLARPVVERGLQTAEARERLARAVAADPPPGTAIVMLNDYGEIEQSSVMRTAG